MEEFENKLRLLLEKYDVTLESCFGPKEETWTKATYTSFKKEAHQIIIDHLPLI